MSDLAVTATEVSAPPVLVAPIPFVPEPLPPSTFADPKSVMGVVPLQFPVAFAGRVWSEIYLRVFTTAQVAAVIRNYDRRLKVDPEAALSFPVYVDADGVDVPEGLMQQLAQDDVDTVSERAADHLPRRFRPTPRMEASMAQAESGTTDEVPSASDPSSGAPTAPSSPM